MHLVVKMFLPTALHQKKTGVNKRFCGEAVVCVGLSFLGAVSEDLFSEGAQVCALPCCFCSGERLHFLIKNAFHVSYHDWETMLNRIDKLGRGLEYFYVFFSGKSSTKPKWILELSTITAGLAYQLTMLRACMKLLKITFVVLE